MPGNGIKNFHVNVKEQDNKVIFLRKLKPGGSEHSFGIHVARMAGIPKTVLNRSDELLKDLERGREQMSAKELGKVKVSPIQLSMFQIDDPVLIGIKDQLQYLDLNTISPIEALLKLSELKKLFEK
jgi:DNA mismatch repair protein MutS